MAGEADRPLAKELSLYITNDGDIYRQSTHPWILNLARKKVKGIYKKALAEKGLVYLAEFGLKKYRREFHFTVPVNKATKELTAKYLLEEIESDIDYQVKELRKMKKAKESLKKRHKSRQK